MRIAYFSDNSYPELSGIVDSILTTGKELARRGHEVVYVGPRYTPKDYGMSGRVHYEKGGREYVEDMPIIRLPSVPVPFSPTKQSRFAFPVGASFSFLDSFKPDIIHTQSPYGTGFEAVRAAKRYRVPLVGTNHTPVEEFYPYAKSAMRRFDAWYYNHCVLVTAPHQGLIDNMRAFGFRREGRAQANPVPFASTPSSAAEKAAAKIELHLEGPVLLCSGRLAPEKKVDDILRAVALLIKELPTLVLLITGHGSAEASLKKLATALKIEKNVRLLGFVASSQLPLLYRAADAYIIMSTAETQSLSLMQAFAAGVPAVSANARGLADYTPADAGFLVSPGDSHVLAEKIAVLLKDAPLRERMGKAGAEFVSTLSPAHIADAWEKIYAEVLTRK